MNLAILRTAFPSRVRVAAADQMDRQLGLALLRSGQAYLGVPHGFWERYVGGDVEIDRIREECGQAGQLVSDLGAPPADYCPRCGVRLREGTVSIRATPANLMPVGAKGTALYYSEPGSPVERVLNYRTDTPARRCPICAGLWIDLADS
jgi:hypothetical protein